MENQHRSTGNPETPLLIKSNTCPACRTAITMLEGKGIRYDTLTAEDDPEAVQRYGIRHVPTLIIPHSDGSWDKLVGTDAIREHIARFS